MTTDITNGPDGIDEAAWSRAMTGRRARKQRECEPWVKALIQRTVDASREVR